MHEGGYGLVRCGVQRHVASMPVSEGTPSLVGCFAVSDCLRRHSLSLDASSYPFATLGSYLDLVTRSRCLGLRHVLVDTGPEQFGKKASKVCDSRWGGSAWLDAFSWRR